MMKRLQQLAAPAVLAAMTFAPQLAYAADYKSTLKDIATKGSDLFINIGYAILLLVAGIALIVIAKEVVAGLGGAKTSQEKNEHIKVAVVVVVLCVIAGFLPMIINSITAIAGQGVDLGTVGASGL